MAITIDWNTRVITVPQSDLTDLGGGQYEMDVNWFRLQLKAIEDDAEGMAYPQTHNHNTEVTISGITLARVVEMTNNYTVTFTPDTPWAVTLVNANSNVFDVVNQNQVNVRAVNSAGLTSDVGSKVANDILATPINTLTDADTFGGWIVKRLLSVGKFLGLK